MPNRSSKPGDVNSLAAAIVGEAVGDEPKPAKDEKNPHAVALGRAGGLKGGKARAAKLTPEERSAIAKKAARARWSER
ncbi:MAG TPA: hypothetical protein VFC99_16695 [Acidimicrobiia bacterium]|nr:hypothetical protein [Acidimicrobiia bacterium]